LFEKADRGKRMHGFTENYIRAELSAAEADERLDNQLVEVTLGEMNADKTALKVQLIADRHG
jgi:threonylcarbamoyladenosine tRNA methylthiotransferase MtaB